MPGDDRGWTKWHAGDQVPQPLLADWCREQMVESAVRFNDQQRLIVNNVVEEHCRLRNWYLHARNCRTNHCHVVVTAQDYNGEQVRDQLKSWATRRLKENQLQLAPEIPVRDHWWSRQGSVRHLFDDASLEAAIQYTVEAQDAGGSKISQTFS